MGKAKKLKNRVSQYFRTPPPTMKKPEPWCPRWIISTPFFVSTEFEALILKTPHQAPPAPVQHPAEGRQGISPLCGWTPGPPYPRFTLAGKAEEDGARYFGPFGGRRETRLAIEAVCGALHLPICCPAVPRDIGRERPCLNHHIGRCDGFCRRAGRPGGVPPPHPPGGAHLQRPLPPADSGAANGDGGGGGGS